MAFTISKNDINNGLIFVSNEKEYSGVKKIAEYVCSDFEKVFRVKPLQAEKKDSSVKMVVFATYENNGKEIAADNKIDISEIIGKRECYKLVSSEDEKILFIFGSDKRGTIYGLFKLSEYIGVSPFVNWADVMPAKKEEVVISDEMLITGKEPSVRYRGFFINDEWPAFGNWANHHFGGVNTKAYERIFELLLRLKGNYLWPAMWASIFSNDGPGLANAELADELGVVMGLSHHEPCLRHGEEYKYLRGKDSVYGDAWNFMTNRDGITRFWEDGLKRSGKFENVITVGMRGEADSTILGKEATLKDNIDLLRDVLKTQNRLIKEYVCPELDKVPRMLALYKEVEPFFYGDENTEGLMDSPELEGVTLMLCDDNHGNLRTLPTEHMKTHNGGYGMYYHFDYHGGPVSFEWVNSSSLYKTWEQMTTAYEAGIRNLWIVNVGDIFTNEYPLSFFLDLAYDFDKWGTSNILAPGQYTKQFADALFGSFSDEKFVNECAGLLEGYTKIAHSRRPEAINDAVYAPMQYGERERLYTECETLMHKALKMYDACDDDIKCAFYEFIYYPLMGNLNLQCMWMDTSYNHFLSGIGASMAMTIADKIEKRINFDQDLVDELHKAYNEKWYGMGLSEHVGFKFWNEEECQYPVIHRFKPSNKARIIAVIPENGEHSEGGVWTKKELTLPDFLRYDADEAYIELYSTSLMDAPFEITDFSEGILVTPLSGIVKAGDMCKLKINLNKSEIKGNGRIHIHGEYMELDINVLMPKTYDNEFPKNTFIFRDSYISAEAGHYSEKTDLQDASFIEIPGFGKTISGMKAFPIEKNYIPEKDSPSVTYSLATEEKGVYTAVLYVAPSNPPYKDYKLYYGVKVNGGKIIINNVIPEDFGIYDGNASWEYGPLNNIRLSEFDIELNEGINSLSIFAVSPGFVLEKIVVYKKNKKPGYGYFGPKETYRTI